MANVDVTEEKKADNQDSDDIDVVQNIFRVILHFIRVILEIIFYPLIWTGKEFVRMWSFLGGGKKNKNKPLNHSEIAFVESLPIFMTILGSLVAIVIGAIAWIRFNDTISEFIADLTRGFDGIVNILKGIWSGFVFVLRLIYDILLGMLDAFVKLFDFLIKDPLFLVIVVMIIVSVIVALYLIISETEYVNIILRKIGYIGLGITDFPRWLYDLLDRVYFRFSKGLGRRTVGGTLVTNRTRTFYQRVVWLVVLYAIWSFIWGIMLLISEILTPQGIDFTSNSDTILSTTGKLLLVLFVSGVISGFVLTFILVMLLNKISGEKYRADGASIDQVRHQSLVSHLNQKIKKYPVLDVSKVAKITDINEEDFQRHWTDATIKDWKLYSKHLVNKTLFNKKIKIIVELEKEGLEKESEIELTKAIDRLSNLQKKFGIVPELHNEIKERKEYLYEDIADFRGELEEGI
ncbi:MAG: hypothetical protein HeimC3_10170 [Candidatus Heimdallarchaeota archaeon LC_3]|nr:MAG: hypothetical protein HeimC3_10170 [Candidatus Heimdallarchaeota archaeon LC_3]